MCGVRSIESKGRRLEEEERCLAVVLAAIEAHIRTGTLMTVFQLASGSPGSVSALDHGGVPVCAVCHIDEFLQLFGFSSPVSRLIVVLVSVSGAYQTWRWMRGRRAAVYTAECFWSAIYTPTSRLTLDLGSRAYRRAVVRPLRTRGTGCMRTSCPARAFGVLHAAMLPPHPWRGVLAYSSARGIPTLSPFLLSVVVDADSRFNDENTCHPFHRHGGLVHICPLRVCQSVDALGCFFYGASSSKPTPASDDANVPVAFDGGARECAWRWRGSCVPPPLSAERACAACPPCASSWRGSAAGLVCDCILFAVFRLQIPLFSSLPLPIYPPSRLRADLVLLCSHVALAPTRPVLARPAQRILHAVPAPTLAALMPTSRRCRTPLQPPRATSPLAAAPLPRPYPPSSPRRNSPCSTTPTICALHGRLLGFFAPEPSACSTPRPRAHLHHALHARRRTRRLTDVRGALLAQRVRGAAGEREAGDGDGHKHGGERGWWIWGAWWMTFCGTLRKTSPCARSTATRLCARSTTTRRRDDAHDPGLPRRQAGVFGGGDATAWARARTRGRKEPLGARRGGAGRWGGGGADVSVCADADAAARAVTVARGGRHATPPAPLAIVFVPPGSPAGVQDVLVFDPAGGVLSLRRVTLRLKPAVYAAGLPISVSLPAGWRGRGGGGTRVRREGGVVVRWSLRWRPNYDALIRRYRLDIGGAKIVVRKEVEINYSAGAYASSPRAIPTSSSFDERLACALPPPCSPCSPTARPRPSPAPCPSAPRWGSARAAPRDAAPARSPPHAGSAEVSVPRAFDQEEEDFVVRPRGRHVPAGAHGPRGRNGEDSISTPATSALTLEEAEVGDVVEGGGEE
ncbi:hypothetical protein C8J57DRAFT_1649888 [Mycena rebaudengoi]|nr:hypothetical protein C8J57DRAFT_1649888 [Mycena rebaudengoi]